MPVDFMLLRAIWMKKRFNQKRKRKKQKKKGKKKLKFKNKEGNKEKLQFWMK